MKRILLIAYVFPPITNPRSIRWAHIIRYLIKSGYEVDVLTITPEKLHENYHEESLALVPERVRVFRTYPGPLFKLLYRHMPPVREGGKHSNKISLKAKLRQKIKTLYKKIIEPFLIPDETVAWLPWGLKELRKLRKNNYDLVISSAKPFTSHIAGYYFKKWTGTPWIMDYGDPWVFNPRTSSIHKWRYDLEKRIEERLLKNVNHITVTTDTVIVGFIRHYPFLSHEKFTVVSNGYDSGRIEKIKPVKGEIFRIVYTGAFHDAIREPYTFFNSMKQLKDIDMEVVIAGSVLPQHLKAGTENGLDGKIIFLGHRPYEEVIALQKGADVLLFLSNKNPLQLPGKIFEYFGACRPILSIQSTENDPAVSLIRKYNRGFVVSNNAEGIASTIRKVYELWQNGELERRFPLEPVKEFTWEYRAMMFENIINTITKEIK